MALAEVDEVELLRLRKLEGTVGSLLKNPAARKHLAKAQKELNPDDPLAKEADAVDPRDQAVADLRAEMAADRKAREEEKAKTEQDNKLKTLAAQREKGFAELRSQRWTAEGIKAVEELMETKGILDPLDAAAIYERDHPPQAPVTPTNHGMLGFLQQPVTADDLDLKGLLESKGANEPLVDRLAMDAIRESRGQPALRR